MAEMINVKEAAELWNLTSRRVSTLCKEGRIPGAVLIGLHKREYDVCCTPPAAHWRFGLSQCGYELLLCG